MNDFEVIAYNATGDMLWLRGADLDAEMTVTVEGARNVQRFMDNLKYAPRYNCETGRFTRNRVALIICRVSAHHEEAWARTAAGGLVRVTPEGQVVGNGMGRSPEEITLGVGVYKVLAATRYLRRRPRTAAAETPRRAEVTVSVGDPETTAIELLDPLRSCRRCKGTGTFRLPSGPVSCRNCSGTGEVPSTRDRRRIEAADRNYYRLIKAMRMRAEERDGRRNGPIEFNSHQGFGLLEQNEPHRLPALFRSLEAGRVDDVIDALVAYRDAHLKAEK